MRPLSIIYTLQVSSPSEMLSHNDVQSFSYNTKLESTRKVIVELVKALTEIRIH